MFLLLCIHSITLISFIHSYHIGQSVLNIGAAFKEKNRPLGTVNESIIVKNYVTD